MRCLQIDTSLQKDRNGVLPKENISEWTDFINKWSISKLL